MEENLPEHIKQKMAVDRAKHIFVNEVLPFLEKMYKEKKHTEFRVAMQSEKHFIIHALGIDSETIDVRWTTEGVSYSHP